MSITSILLASASILFALPNVDAYVTHGHQHQQRAPIGNLTFKSFAASSYRQVDSYHAGNFFDNFNFFQGSDPTHGFVNYQSRGDAQNQGLANEFNNQVYLGVDSNTLNPQGGRKSVRITSNKAYTHGLFIADIAHMPGSACGSWPAYWMFGPNWPAGGEIDIIEGVHGQTTNIMNLHTAPGCVINTAGSQGGTTLLRSNCNSNNGFDGCGVSTSNSQNYGDGFNNVGGGVYAMQWESSGVYIWFFPRYAIPSDITAQQPVTGNWGTPLVAFNGGSGCNIDSFFRSQNLVFDTTFCGDWAGGVWGNSGCASQASSCEAYVAGNPGAYKNTYWSINSLKVYQL